MSIKELIDELRAASDVVGADADVELKPGQKVLAVKTGTRTASIEAEGDDEFDHLKQAAQRALSELRAAL